MFAFCLLCCRLLCTCNAPSFRLFNGFRKNTLTHPHTSYWVSERRKCATYLLTFYTIDWWIHCACNVVKCFAVHDNSHWFLNVPFNQMMFNRKQYWVWLKCFSHIADSIRGNAKRRIKSHEAHLINQIKFSFSSVVNFWNISTPHATFRSLLPSWNCYKHPHTEKVSNSRANRPTATIQFIFTMICCGIHWLHSFRMQTVYSSISLNKEYRSKMCFVTMTIHLLKFVNCVYSAKSSSAMPLLYVPRDETKKEYEKWTDDERMQLKVTLAVAD